MNNGKPTNMIFRGQERIGSGVRFRSRGRGSRLDEPRGLLVVSQRLDRVRKAEGTEAHREGK